MQSLLVRFATTCRCFHGIAQKSHVLLWRLAARPFFCTASECHWFHVTLENHLCLCVVEWWIGRSSSEDFSFFLVSGRATDTLKKKSYFFSAFLTHGSVEIGYSIIFSFVSFGNWKGGRKTGGNRENKAEIKVSPTVLSTWPADTEVREIEKCRVTFSLFYTDYNLL